MFSTPHGSSHEMNWQTICESTQFPTEVKEGLDHLIGHFI